MEKKINDLVILIPAFNEEKNLKKILIELKNIADTLIVNDGSTDLTKKIAKTFATFVINNNKNYGYDYSLIRGFKFLLKKKYKYILTFDADGQHRISDIRKIFKIIKSNKTNCVIGVRDSLNRHSEKLASSITSFLFNIRDPFSGFKCYKFSYLKKLFNLININEIYLGLFFFNLNKKIKCKQIKVSKAEKSSIGFGLNSEIFFIYIFFKRLILR